MSNQIAIGLAAVVVAVILADIGLNAGHGLVFMLRKLGDLVEYLAVWR